MMLKSLFLMIPIILLSQTAQARSYELACAFESVSDKGKLFITVDDLFTDKVSLNYDTYTTYEGDEAAFSYNHESLEWLWYLALSWDGQHVEKDARGNLVFSLDSDGCDVGVIYLYGNSNFKYGYLKVDHYCGTTDKTTYSKAKCEINSL